MPKDNKNGFDEFDDLFFKEGEGISGERWDDPQPSEAEKAKQEAEQAALKKAEEDAARRKADEEAARRKADEEAARRKAEQEAEAAEAHDERGAILRELKSLRAAVERLGAPR